MMRNDSTNRNGSSRISRKLVLASVAILSVLLLSSFVLIASHVEPGVSFGFPVVVGQSSVNTHSQIGVSLGQVPSNLLMSASVGMLNTQKASQLNELVQSMYTPNSPNYHHFLSTSKFSSEFGPSPSTYKTAVSYFQSQGLTVYTDKNQMFINLVGTAAQFETAFSTDLQLFKSPSGTVLYANTESLSLPSTFAGSVTSAIGFENYTFFEPAAVTVPCPSCQASGQPPYVPQGVETAYNETALLASGRNGAGQTIVLVDAFGDPTAQADLAEFDTTYNLPSPTLTIANVNSTATATDVQQDGGGVSPEWALETALDLEYSHAMAPGAALVNAIGVDEGPGLAEAISMAIADHLGNIVSQSFGIWEYNAWYDCGSGDTGSSCYGSPPPTTFDVGALSFAAYLDPYFTMAAATGITVLASTGDSGSGVDCCADTPSTQAVNYPAINPYVAAVGGTALSTTQTPPGITGGGQVTGYSSESAWTDGGGGVSTIYPRMSWQTGYGVPTSAIPMLGGSPGQTNPDTLSNGSLARMIPDVSADADPNTGVCIILAGANTCAAAVAAEEVGGTSLASPLWAGVVAVWNQNRGVEIGALGPVVYQILNSKWYTLVMHDVTTGNNNDAAPGYSAGPGYDLATGVGTPNVGELAQCGDTSSGTLNCALNIPGTGGSGLTITSPTAGQTITSGTISVTGTDSLAPGNFITGQPGVAPDPQQNIIAVWANNYNSGTSTFNVNMNVTSLSGGIQLNTGDNAEDWQVQFTYGGTMYEAVFLFVATGNGVGVPPNSEFPCGIPGTGASYCLYAYDSTAGDYGADAPLTGSYSTTAPGVITMTIPLSALSTSTSMTLSGVTGVTGNVVDGVAVTDTQTVETLGSFAYTLGQPLMPDGSVQVSLGSNFASYVTASLVNYPDQNNWQATLTLSNPVAGQSFTIYVRQDVNGVYSAVSTVTVLYK